MTGKTHRAGGMLCSIVGFAILKENGLLLPDINEGIQWLVMYPFSMWGSVASDLDHDWSSCPSKDYPSWCINKLLHISKPVQKLLDNNMRESEKKKSIAYKVISLFNAKHRSWQTHSDLTLFTMLFLLDKLINNQLPLGVLDNSILTLVLMGLVLGVVAHFILDILTPDGIWCTGLVILNKLLNLLPLSIRIPQKIHLVPRKTFFITGGKWEQGVQKFLRIATIVALVWLGINLFLPNIQSLLPFKIEFAFN